MIQTVTVVGAGNVGTHLIKALYEAGYTIRQVIANRETSATVLAEVVEAEAVANWNQIDEESDLYIVTTPDTAIGKLANYWSTRKGLVVHTAGSVSIDALTGIAPSIGVLYPLQTFSKERPLNLRTVPFFHEASDEKSDQVLQSVIKALGSPAYPLTSESREYLHLAAILTNNFTNYLLSIAGEQLHKRGLDFNLLDPLIKETIAKALDLGPEAAQTGPAKRGDTTTIEHHKQLLDNEDQKAVYQIMSTAIYRHFHR